MKKYRVNVNGTDYEVAVELIGEEEIKAPAKAPEKAEVKAVPAANTGGVPIKSPMPGTILAVNVAQGASVKKGQVLLVLEAMKMENEIMAPSDGTVAALNVSKGATVESGDILCVIA